MPAIATDAKAHTWPGALCQTYMKYDGTKYIYCETGVDVNSTTNVETALQTLTSGRAGKTYDSAKDTAVQMNIEVYQIADDLKNSGYTAVGFVRVE